MPVVKVADIAYGRLQSPSLDEAEEFLLNFDMHGAEKTCLNPLAPWPVNHSYFSMNNVTIFELFIYPAKPMLCALTW